MLDLQKGCLDLQIIKTPKELNDWAKKNKVNGKTIGLVPTMGLSLIHISEPTRP